MRRHFDYGPPEWLKVEEYDYSAGIDHPRMYKKKIAIFFPYGAQEGLAEFITSIHKQGFCLDINGASPYWPGHTFTIMVWRPQDKDLAHEVRTMFRESIPKDGSTKDWQ